MDAAPRPCMSCTRPARFRTATPYGKLAVCPRHLTDAVEILAPTTPAGAVTITLIEEK